MMQGRKPIRPTRLRGRRSVHGALCRCCGSSRVFVTHTITQILAADGTGRELERRQGLLCGQCGSHWWRTLRIDEIVVEPQARRTGGTAEKAGDAECNP
jgi:hypothetical protein